MSAKPRPYNEKILDEQGNVVLRQRQKGKNRKGEPILGWRLRVRDPRDSSHQPEKTIFATEAEAIVELARFAEEVIGAPIRPARRVNAVTVADAYADWLAEYQWKAQPAGAFAGQERPNTTVGNLISYANAYLLRDLGTRRIATVTIAELREHIGALTKIDPATGKRADLPLSPVTKAKVASLVRMVWGFAERTYGIAKISDQVPTGWGKTTSRRTEIVPSLLSMEKLARAMDDEWKYPGWATPECYGPNGEGRGDIVRLIAFSGMRWEETAAMPLSLVRWKARYMLMRDTASESGGFREYRTDEGKSEAALRHLAIVDQLTPVLKRLRAFRDAGLATEEGRELRRLARADRGKRPPNRPYEQRWQLLVNSDKGGFLSRSTWDAHLMLARKASGVDLTAHALRHVAASLLYAAGAKVSEITEQMGHSTDETTRKKYRHMFNVERAEMIRRISQGIDAVEQAEIDEAERQLAAEEEGVELAAAAMVPELEDWD